MPVTGFEIRSRQPFEGGRRFGNAGAYERLDGVLHFSVDPVHPANTPVVDLDRAARDAGGRVSFAAEVTVLQPVEARGANGRLLLDVVNRGGRTFVAYNLAARSPEPDAIPAGDGFLMARGWTVVACGWQWDVPRGGGLLGLDAPEALEAGRPIEGWVSATLQTPIRAPQLSLADRGHQPYAAADLEQPDATMTVRAYPDAPREVVPRARWRFADAGSVALDGGFEAGRIFEVVYRTDRSPVVGTGLLAVRDAATYFRCDTSAENPAAGRIGHAFAFGVSQSGRLLRTLLHHGLNIDEDGRQAFHGVHAHVAGARRGQFNHRYAQPSVQSPPYAFGHLPPFGYEDDTDPVTGRHVPGLLAPQRALGGVPRIIATNSATEYWRGDAALMHVDLGGSRDLPDAPEARSYLLAAAQHSSGAALLTNAAGEGGARGANLLNIVSHGPALRAALVNLERWVCDGVEPPPSALPRLRDGTAVTRAQAVEPFARFPTVSTPRVERLLTLPRLDLGPDAARGVATWPVTEGARFPTLVSAVDDDGNEVAGIRLPEVAVPIATFAGWNPRDPETGGEGRILPTSGSTMPFAATKSERELAGDPRASLEERYRDRADYLARIRQVAEDLAARGYLLEVDVGVAVEHAAARWELLAAVPAK